MNDITLTPQSQLPPCQAFPENKPTGGNERGDFFESGGE